MQVFVLDNNRKPLDPCHPARARSLMKEGRAAVFRRFPFTIILKDRLLEDSVVHEHRVKIDPGSKVTGIAIVAEETKKVVFAAELEHRGSMIKSRIDARRSKRKDRRHRNTRYRQARFLNRTKTIGWIAPSLMSRIYNIETWVAKFRKFCPISTISMELVRFDFQKMENPEILGVEYQRGELQGYEVREYLLEKWGRRCVYCPAKNVPLQIEHIVPKSRGGTNRISNLTLACELCNQKKGSSPIEEFLKSKPDLLAKIKRQAKLPMKDASAVNMTRLALLGRLRETGLPVEIGSGGKTKFNRVSQGYPKAHWVDAACVGENGSSIKLDSIGSFLEIKATGHGNRQMCGTDKYGFPKCHRTRTKKVKGFQTGDMVRALIPSGKNIGNHTGRVTVMANGRCEIATSSAKVRSVNLDYCETLSLGDGYRYSLPQRLRITNDRLP